MALNTDVWANAHRLKSTIRGAGTKKELQCEAIRFGTAGLAVSNTYVPHLLPQAEQNPFRGAVCGLCYGTPIASLYSVCHISGAMMHCWEYRH